MKALTRRSYLTGAALSAVALVAAPVVAQTAFPTKPLKIVVPNAAGGAADITARTVAQKLSEVLGQAVVIENKPSAGGIVAGELVARADPDGHTLLLISSGTAVSAGLFKSLPFDTLKDFAPVSKLATFDLVIAVAEGSRFKSFAEMLAYGRANPGKLNIGTPQVGTTQNLAAELFLSTAGLQAQIVPFNGTPPVITALRGGSLDAMLDILGPVMPQIKSNALRPLAMLSEKRALNLPEVPTVQEAGGSLSKFYVGSWNGLAVPAKTPRDVVQRLNAALSQAVKQKEIEAKLIEAGLTPWSSTPEELSARINAEVDKWVCLARQANIQPE